MKKKNKKMEGRNEYNFKNESIEMKLHKRLYKRK